MTKKFTPTKGQIVAARAVFMAMTLVDMIRPVVNGYQTAILAEHQWPIARKLVSLGLPDAPVLKPSDSFMMEDADFTEYLRLCNDARKAANLYVDNEEHCPLLVAEKLLTDAENALINSMSEITGMDADQVFGASMDTRAKVIDLMLKLLAPFVGDAKAMLGESL